MTGRGVLLGTVLVALLWGLGLAVLGATPVDAEQFPLQTRELTVAEMEMLQGSGTSVGVNEAPPAGLKAQPTYASNKPYYALLVLGSRSPTGAVSTRIAAFDRSQPKAQTYDLLYVDRDGDQDLAEEKPVRAARFQGRITYFPPVTLTVSLEGKTRQVGVRVRTYNFGPGGAPDVASFDAASCLEGTVSLSGRPYKVALVDGDLSGVFGDAVSSRGGDRLLIDVNGNGRYDQRGSYPTPAAQENRPLSECWQVGSNWWQGTVVGDGNALRVEPAQVEYGELRCQGPQITALQLISKRYGVFTPGFKGGSAKLPVGEHAVESVRLTAKDEQGRQWQLSASGPMGGEGSIRISADRPAELDFSRPLVGSVRAQKQGQGQVDFALEVATAAGQSVRSLFVGREGPPEPTFSITDASGKEVASGKFEYG